MNNTMETLDVINTNSNSINTEDNIFDKKKKRKKIIKRIIIVLVILIILALGGLYYYKENVLLNKNKIIKESISQIFNTLNNGVEEFNKNILPFDANEESIGIEGTFKVTSNYKNDDMDLSKLGDYSIKYNTALDLKENKMSGSIFLNKNDYSLLSLNTYINGKFGTLESRQLSYYAYNYNIDKEIKDIKINNKNNKDNVKKLINRTKDIILSKINANDITKDSYEETINGSKATYTRFTYKVNINNLTNEVLKYYIQDTSLLNTLSEVTNTDSNTLKQIIQSIIDNNKGSEVINYEIYVDSLFGTFKQMKIYNTNDSNTYFKLVKNNNNYDYEFVYGENKINGKYSNNILDINIDQTRIEFEKVNDNIYKINNKFVVNDSTYEVTLDFKSKIEEDKQNIKLYLTIKNNDVEVNFDIETNITKNVTVKPIAAFITKDISTIDENEENDILIKYENIIENVIKDIYSGNFENIKNNNGIKQVLDFKI